MNGAAMKKSRPGSPTSSRASPTSRKRGSAICFHGIGGRSLRYGRPRNRGPRRGVTEFLAGETLHGLAKRHDISRNLIRVWVERYQTGALDEDAAAADLLQQYEARIAALERLVGKQALELEFLKGGSAKRAAERPGRPRLEKGRS